MVWMLHIGWARHLGPVAGGDPVDYLSVEFINIGGGLTHGDNAWDSCAQFLAVAEQRLILDRTRPLGHQLWKAGLQSVWALTCQDQISVGHAGVGVILWPLLSLRCS